MNNRQLLLKKTHAFAENKMGKEVSHDYRHAVRASVFASKIALGENLGDPLLYQLTALLHDVGLGHGDRKKHAEIGARMAADFLSEINSNEVLFHSDIHNIAFAINWHSNRVMAPQQSELLNVLADSDTIDLLGAVGIWRGITANDNNDLPTREDLKQFNVSHEEYNTELAAKRSENSHEIAEQLAFQISCAELLFYPTSKKIAAPRLNIMRKFRHSLVVELVESDNDA